MSFSRQQGSLVCDGVPLADARRGRTARRSTSTAPRRSPRAIAPIDEAFASLSARDALRAQGELDAGDRAAAARASAAAPTPTPAARSTSRCAPASFRRRSSSPASARRAAELGAGDRPRRQDDQRRVGRRARAHRRASRARGRRGRGSPCGSIPTSTRRAIRTSRPASRPTSSASPIDDVARAAADARAAAPGLEIVGLHVHVGSQITDLEPLRARRDALVDARARAAAPTASRSSISISAAASASRTTARRRRRRHDYAAARAAGGARIGPVDRPRARPQHRRAGRRAR